MKNLIISLLAKGYIKTKYTTDELCKDYYFIKQIIEQDKTRAVIKCKHNSFWEIENIINRTQLIHDIAQAGRGFSGKTNIFNRYEKGDKYGITV